MTKTELLKRLDEIGTEIAGLNKPDIGDKSLHWLFCVADGGSGENDTVMAECFSNVRGEPLVNAGAALAAILHSVPNSMIVEFQDDLFKEFFYQTTVRNNLTDEQRKDEKFCNMARRAAEMLFGICKKGMMTAGKDFIGRLLEEIEPKEATGCKILVFPRPKGPVKPGNN